MTTIQWTDETWNPTRGCSRVSAGCDRCYAMRQAHRFSGKGKPYEGLTRVGPRGVDWSGAVRLVPEKLLEPLRWRKPRRVFVDSMSDLFHPAVPDEFIDQVFAVMEVAHVHAFQVLTKRPERMLKYMTAAKAKEVGSAFPFPRQNIWLGVSVEDQATADARIPVLLETPAAVRFVSAEPLLEWIDLGRYLRGGGLWWWPVWSNGARRVTLGGRPAIDWVILGGESGRGARPCAVRWVRSIVEQCQHEGVPVFVKQLGSNAVLDEYVARRLRSPKGGYMGEWPAGLQVREFPR